MRWLGSLLVFCLITVFIQVNDTDGIKARKPKKGLPDRDDWDKVPDRNLTKRLKHAGEKEIRKLAAKLNCSRLERIVTNGTSKWDCSDIRGLRQGYERCRKANPKAFKTDGKKSRAMARCGLLPHNITREEFKKIGKAGGFKDASKHVKRKYGEKIEEKLGDARNWTIDDLEDIKYLLDYIPDKTLKKIPRHVALKIKRPPSIKAKKSALFRDIFPHGKRRNLTTMDILSICKAGFQSELRGFDIKRIPERELRNISKCFDSPSASPSAKREYAKRVCSSKKGRKMDKEQIQKCAGVLCEIRPSDLKNPNNTELYLDAYLKRTKKSCLSKEGKIILAKICFKKYGDKVYSNATLARQAADLFPYFPKRDLSKLIGQPKAIRAIKKKGKRFVQLLVLEQLVRIE